MDEEYREIYNEFLMLLMEEEEGSGESSIEKQEPLPKVMSYMEVETMVLHLIIQLKALEARGCSLLIWQVSDILLVNNKYYLLANLTQLVPMYKKAPDKIVLNYPAIFPFPKESCAPELLQMAALPFITHKSVSYYSLALLCLAKLNLSLETLQGTKLFYFLERCLKIEPSERTLYNLL